jgi:hypothetical protein
MFNFDLPRPIIGEEICLPEQLTCLYTEFCCVQEFLGKEAIAKWSLNKWLEMLGMWNALHNAVRGQKVQNLFR